MPRTTVAVGGVLIAVGVIAYIVIAFASWTALIPAILGAVILICGLIALRRPTIGVSIALAVALLGILGTASNVIQLGEVFVGTAERPAAVIASTITFVLLVVYLVLGVRSFVVARRRKSFSS